MYEHESLDAEFGTHFSAQWNALSKSLN